MVKSLLNNLFGRFGIALGKPITELLDQETFDRQLMTYKIVSYKKISEDKLLVSYIPSVDVYIINDKKLDLVKLL